MFDNDDFDKDLKKMQKDVFNTVKIGFIVTAIVSVVLVAVTIWGIIALIQHFVG